eukprot:TRINITY_DN62779_c0_g1_i1.p1 TRINITY_DN62779_c0_g1~~TRINITY_DN62779_c0_g1_i1.p1  ORF type:complete len:188 (-),score=48.88 TRINITY_DN62779_c0_g1_i1:134-697(-)
MALDESQGPLPLLKARFSEIFDLVSPSGRLCRETYEGLPLDVLGNMPEDFDGFLSVADRMGVSVNADEGMTQAQYVEMNMKSFLRLTPAELETRAPEALGDLGEMLMELRAARDTADAAGAGDDAGLRRRAAGDRGQDVAREFDGRKPGTNSMGGEQLDAPTERKIALAFVALWSLLLLVGYQLFRW